MNCQQANPLLSAYADDELASDLRSQVLEHVSCCAACSDDLAGIAELSRLARSLPNPLPAENLWDRIETEMDSLKELPSLDSGTRIARSGMRWGNALGRWRRVAVIAAVVGVLATLTSFWSGPGHDHAAFASVIDKYVDTFQTDPKIAQSYLLSQYEHVAVEPEDAIKHLGYRPKVADGLPPDLTLTSMNVVSMPCCKCVQCTVLRTDGAELAIFEHDETTMQWFPHCPTVKVRCQSTECSLVQLDQPNAIAASWKQGTRKITVIGLDEMSEVDQLVAWFDRDRQVLPQ